MVKIMFYLIFLRDLRVLRGKIINYFFTTKVTKYTKLVFLCRLLSAACILQSAVCHPALSFWTIPEALAEDRPDNFFQKGYVNDPKLILPSSESLPKAKPGKTPALIISDKSEEPTNTNTRTEEMEYLLPLSQQRGIPVQSIDLVVASLDKKHFQDKVKELITLSDNTGVRLGVVMAVGNLDSILDLKKKPEEFLVQESEEPLLGLGPRGGHLKLVEAPPKELGLTMSPSYLVHTKEGTFVFEAVSAIQKYFNKYGELVKNVIAMNTDEKVDKLDSSEEPSEGGSL